MGAGRKERERWEGGQRGIDETRAGGVVRENFSI